MDLADLLVQTLQELRQIRDERHLYRGWFCAALDELHAQHREIERQRRQLASLREELRRGRRAEPEQGFAWRDEPPVDWPPLEVAQ